MNRVSFFQNKKITCPVCESKFAREIMMTGRGRLLANNLMVDLRRSYKKSEKYGEINPLIYNIIVCPKCLYAALPEDFSKLPKDSIEKINNTKEARKKIR